MYGLDPWTTRLDGDNAMCITRLQIHRHWWKRDPGCKYIVSQRQWQRVARFGGTSPETECGVRPMGASRGEPFIVLGHKRRPDAVPGEESSCIAMIALGWHERWSEKYDYATRSLTSLSLHIFKAVVRGDLDCAALVKVLVRYIDGLTFALGPFLAPGLGRQGGGSARYCVSISNLALFDLVLTP